MSLLRIDHVQITVPWARECEARHFYASVLGLREVDQFAGARADVIAFAFDEATELHIVLASGPLPPPASEHVGVVVEDLSTVKRRLSANGVYYFHPASAGNGRARIFIQDPFGNRLELIDGGKR